VLFSAYGFWTARSRRSTLNGEPTSIQPPKPPVRTTPWADLSLFCSLGVFCPVFTALGPILGVKALAEIRSKPGTTGTGIAGLGIGIGLLATLLWIGAGLWWNSNVRKPIITGPAAELTAGLHGDIGAFKAGFHGEGATVDDAVAAAFLAELAGRYGMMLRAVQSETRETPDTAWGAINPIVPYDVQFEGAFVAAEAEFVIYADDEPGIIAKWRWIIISDPELGDLAYPPNAFEFRERALQRIEAPPSPIEEAGDEASQTDASAAQ
jgi:hypothetical protein